MKFIMAYSGGKDCTLALDRMIAQGNEPVCLFTTVTKKQLSFKHGIRPEVFAQYEKCLNIPVVSCYGDTVHEEDSICKELRKIIDETGADALCTGDIYRADVYEWNRSMAELLGVELITPLWNEPPEELISELLEKGYKCCIKVVKTDKLPETFLGKILDQSIAESLQGEVDLCGEDGEYHTITLDGPIFHQPLKVTPGRVVSYENISMLDMFSADNC